ncbi:ankyrin repeat domain-containing protein [Undibacterium sp. SXout11W]|uniref:ankyrin repeat domain-containing protein n=1 Tax=Undibacterium sp. SXout11W TaxID=3413050 RepID=UPI003BF18A2D
MKSILNFVVFKKLRKLVLQTMCGLSILMGVQTGAGAANSSYDDFIFAVKFNDAATVSSLLQRGMDPNSVDALRGESALMIAIREKSIKVIETLLNAPDIKLEQHARNGDTALMLASFLGDIDVVKKLFAAGAEVNQPGWSAVHYAAASGSVETLDFLLEHAAYIDSESPNKTTPLMMALRFGKYDTAKVLIDAGADINLKNDAGMTAMNFAQESERKDLILLLKNRAAALQK